MSMKFFLIIFLAAFGLMILGAIVGHLLESSGGVTRESLGSRGAMGMRIFFFVLFCVLGFSIVPLAVRVFVVLQLKIGNAELFLVRFLQAHEQAVVYGIWGAFLIGLCFAIPGGIKDGFFR